MPKFLFLICFLIACISSYPQVIITEIMADPNPVVGLPDNEWIEIKNVSGADVNLENYRFRKPNYTSGNFPNFILKKDSFVIVTGTSYTTTMSAFGATIAISRFPSLTNSGDIVYLENGNGTTLHAIQYSTAWYSNELKAQGGWSLEMIDTDNACTGTGNWTASTDKKGGTPGQKNAVSASNPDNTPPQLLNAYPDGTDKLVLVFSESLDSTNATAVNNYLINETSIAAATPVGPFFNRVILNLNNALQANKGYTVTVSAITDCRGNAIGASNFVRTGISAELNERDLVINEILFNPKSGGVDFVELYNRSNKVLDLKDAYLANRNTQNQFANITQLSTESRLIFPGEYFVATEDFKLLLRDYIAENPLNFVEINLPSYNDASGNVILLNKNGTSIDEVSYTEKWHYALLSDKEGVSLERIDPDGISQDANNWQSASSTAGFATPTYKNSQFLVTETVQGELTISPKTISPDNDGMDDQLTISYHFSEGGYTANITIFDSQGRPVRYLVKSGLMGTTGVWRWDGLGDRQQKLPVGVYVVYSEIFNLQGKTKKFKQAVVVARKF